MELSHWVMKILMLTNKESFSAEIVNDFLKLS